MMQAVIVSEALEIRSLLAWLTAPKFFIAFTLQNCLRK
jgi:hypothetical protein